jgi:hypothetical protein
VVQFVQQLFETIRRLRLLRIIQSYSDFRSSAKTSL